jgi:methionyl-tRNA formyltransferase
MIPWRVVFMGTADLACPSLAALAASSAFEVVGVITQPDRPKGRDLRWQPTPVKETALRLGLTVFQPERIKHESALTTLQDWAPAVIVVVAYGQILPKTILDLPPRGGVNVHASILPQYRGAAPIQWAILNGERESGITLMKMDAGLDTGDILAMEKTEISLEDNAQTLHDRLAAMGARLLLATLPNYLAGGIVPQPQPKEGGVYARKINKEDGLIEWRMTAIELWNRGFNPWPGAYTHLTLDGRPQLVKVWRARIETGYGGEPGTVLHADAEGIIVACGQHALRLMELQREGRRRLPAAEFLLGTRLVTGMKMV